MKKNILHRAWISLLLTFLLLCMGVWASDTAYTLQDGVLTVSGNGAMTDYAAQTAPWYAQRDQITSVVVEEGVTAIGDYAFADCPRLQSVTIADSVTTVGKFAFANCSLLSSMPYATQIRSLGEGAFSRCNSLQEIILPSSVESIEKEAFYGCNHAKLLWLGSHLKGIGANAFTACDALTEIRVNSGNNVFSATDGLLLSADKSVLYLCPGGKSGAVIVPTTVKTIADSAFEHCHKVTEVDLSKTVTIGAKAFADCSAITSVTLPNTVTEIGANAFLRCTALASFQIGSGLRYLGAQGSLNNDVFEGCGALATITGSSSYYHTIDNVLFNSTEKQLLFCPRTKAGRYTLPATVTKIADKAFAGCTELTGIVLPAFEAATANTPQYDGLARIESFAFAGCTKLTSVSIPATVTAIGSGAFADCTALTSITVNAANEKYKVANYLLYEISSNSVLCVPAGRSSATISGRAKTDPCAFWGCKMTALNIDATLTKLGNDSFDEVFYGCTALKKINVDAGNTQYASDDNGILYNKAKTKILYCPQAIDGECDIPATVTSVDDRTFAGRINLSVIRFAQDGVTASIGERAFANCTALEEVKLGEAVTVVGSGAFSGCSDLQLVFFNGGLPTESSNPFYDIGDDVEVISLEDGIDGDTWNGIASAHYQKIVAYYDAAGKMVAVQFMTVTEPNEMHTQQAGESRKVIYLLPDHTPFIP